MTIEANIRQYLMTRASVTDYVGEAIRPDRLVQGIDDYPGITISVTQERPQNDLDGDGGLEFADIEVTIWDPDRTRCRAIGEQVRLSLAGADFTVAGQLVKATYEGGDVEEVPNDDGSDGSAYAFTQQYEVSFSETVAFP